MFNYTLDEYEILATGMESVIEDAKLLNLKDQEDLKYSQEFIRDAEKLLNRVTEHRTVYEKLLKPL